MQPSTKHFLIRSSSKAHQQEKEKSSLCAQGDFTSTFKALKRNQSSLLLKLWVLCRWLLRPSIKAVIRSHGTNGRTPGADQGRLFWVRGECVWWQARNCQSPGVGCSVYEDTVGTRHFQQLHVTLGPLTARLLKAVNFYFLPFIKLNVYSIPYLSSAESLLHHGPCREDIPLSAEGGLVKAHLFHLVHPLHVQIWILCKFNLYSTVFAEETWVV